MEKKISAIIPSNNNDKIINTIKSIRNFVEEIIIVNSAKDDCVIPNEYNVKIVQCKKEKTNASKARNIGATEAKNEILFFIDADVEVDPSSIEHFKKSSENSQVKKIHHNHLFNQFNLNKSSGKVHLVNDEVLDDEFKKNYQTISLTGKKGDLVLLDLKSVHYASKIKKGERHLLWLYY